MAIAVSWTLEQWSQPVPKRSFTPEELQGAHEDPARMRELIGASAGYVLVKMRGAGLSPSLESLLEDPHPESIGFILDHYEISDVHRDAIAPLLVRSHGNARLAGSLTEAQVDAALLSGRALPATVALNMRQFREHAAGIEAQFEHGEDEASDLVLRSAKAVGVGDFVKLDRDFLVRHAWVLEQMDVFGDEGLSQLYKELVLERGASKGKRPSLSSFESWRFGPADGAFLWELISNDPRTIPTWEDLGKIHGAHGLLDPWEFYARTGRSDIKNFADGLLESRLEEVRSDMVALCSKEPGRARMGAVLEMKCDLSQFAKLFDAKAAKAAIQAVGSVGLDSIYRDDDKSRRKVSIMAASMLEAALDDWEGLGSKMAPRDFAGLAIDLCKRAKGWSAEEREKTLAARCFAEGFAKLMGNDLAVAAIRDSGSIWFGDGMLGWMQEFARSEPTPNLMVLAMQEKSRAVKNGGHGGDMQAELIAEICQQIAARIDLPTAKALCPMAGIQVPKGRRRLPANPSFNVLSMDYASLDEATQGAGERQVMLASIDGAFIQRMEQVGASAHPALLSALLREGSEASLSMLEQLLPKFDDLKAQRPDFFKQALSHPMGERLLGAREVHRLEEQAMAQAKSIAAQKLRLELAAAKMRALAPARAEGDSWRSILPNPTLEALEKQSYEAAAGLGQALEGVSHALASRELAGALERGEYALFGALASRSSHHDSGAMFAKAAGSMGEALFLSKLSDSGFKELLVGSVDYNGKTKMGLDFGAAESNARVAKALLALFKEPSNALRVFKPEACREFSGDFSIEHWPRMSVYDYRLKPRPKGLRGRDSDRALVAPHSNEQLLRLWGKLGAQGWFSSGGANDHASDMLRENFMGRPQEFEQFAKLSESQPVLHLILASADLSLDLRAEPQPGSGHGESRDMRSMRFMLKKFDWSVLMKGVQELLQVACSNERSGLFSVTLAMEVVDKIIGLTHWEDSTGNAAERTRSELGEERSLQLASLIAAKAPTMLHRIGSIGTIQSLCDHMQSHASRHLGEDGLESVFMPPGRLAGDGMDLSGRRGERAEKVMLGALTWMISERRDSDIEYLDWACKQRQFMESEIDWDHRPEWRGADGEGLLLDPLDYFIKSQPLQELLAIGMERLSLKRASGDIHARRAKARSL